MSQSSSDDPSATPLRPAHPDAVQWRRDKDRLATLLELEAAARASHLAEIELQDPDGAQRLRRLLEAAGPARDFLESTPLDELTSAAPPLPSAGDRLGPYRIEREIARGGMATVFRAQRDDDIYAKTVAIKVVRPDFSAAEDLERLFARERRILATLEHPNIASIYDAGTTPDGLGYLVMEYCDGVSIDEYCDHNRLTIDQRLDLFEKICETVDFAHSRLVVHSDLKPSNILVDREGSPRLLDFGVAELLHEQDADSRLIGWTPEFASPEREALPASTSSDVYSLGVLLYRLLCGRRPHPSLNESSSRRSSEEVRRAVREEEVVPLSRSLDTVDAAERAEIASRRRTGVERLRRRLGGDLEAVIDRALAREPTDRYPDVGALLDDLRAVRSHRPTNANPPGNARRVALLLRRQPVGSAIAAVLVGLLLFLTLQTVRLSRERDRVEAERRDAERLADTSLNLFSAVEGVEAGDATAIELIEKIRGQLEHQEIEPLAEARQRFVLARVFSQLGAADDAVEQLEQVVALRTGALGPEHRRTLEAEIELGHQLQSMRRFDDALEQLQDVRQRTRDALGEDDAVHGIALARLAWLYSLLPKAPEDPTPLFERALEILEDHDDELLKARLRRNLGASLFFRGQRDRGIEEFEKGASNTRQLLGPSHLVTSGDDHTRGLMLAALGRPGEANESYRRAIASRTAILGPRHPRTLLTQTVYGNNLALTGRMLEAAELFTAIVEQRSEVAEDAFPTHFARIMSATAEAELGRTDAARRLLDRVGAAAERREFSRTHEYARAMIELAEGRSENAVAGFERLLAIRRETHAAGDAMITSVEVALGRALDDAGRFEQARAVLQSSIDGISGRRGEDHPDLVEAWLALARVELQDGRRGETSTLANRSRDALRAAGVSSGSWFVPAADLLAVAAETPSPDRAQRAAGHFEQIRQRLGDGAIETRRARRLMDELEG